MINIFYNRDGIKVETQNVSDYGHKTPLLINFIKHISKEIQWTEKLGDWMWAAYPETEIFDVQVCDNDGNIIVTKEWDFISDGSELYKKVYFLIKSLGESSNGIVIGTNNGEFGEWIPIAVENNSKIVLVEATKQSFNKLKNNYSKYDKLIFLNHLVTPDGLETVFYEDSKEGYCNSVFKNVLIDGYNLKPNTDEIFEPGEIREVLKPSIKLGDIILNEFNGKIDWLHLDVEGLDADLIMSLNKNLYDLPKIIVFENNHLKEKQKNKLDVFLEINNYKVEEIKHVSIAIKNN